MEKNKLYVGNIPTSANKEQLEELFSRYGNVQQVNIIQDKGYAFVEMSSPSEAEAAKGLNGAEFQGQLLKIDQARPLKPRQARDYRRY